MEFDYSHILQVDVHHIALNNTKPKFLTFYAEQQNIVSNMKSDKQKKKSDITNKMSKQEVVDPHYCNFY